MLACCSADLMVTHDGRLEFMELVNAFAAAYYYCIQNVTNARMASALDQTVFSYDFASGGWDSNEEQDKELLKRLYKICH